MLHTLLLKLAQMLNYLPKDVLGICRGFSLRWIEAYLSGSEQIFLERIERIERIANTDVSVENINSIKEKVKQGKTLTQEEYDLFDILAFFESTACYVTPNMFPSLFNAPITQASKVEEISKIASSEELLKSGGLMEVSSELGIYTKEEAIAYLNELAQIFLTTYGETANAKIALALTSTNHSISLIFDIEKKLWIWADSNHFPPRAWDINATDAIVDMISLSFYKTAYNAPLVFNTEVITVGNDPKREILTKQCAEIKKQHKRPTDIAQREHVEEIVWLAAQRNDLKTLKLLAKKRVKLDLPDTRGLTAAAMACAVNNVEALVFLQKHGVDLNAPVQIKISLDPEKPSVEIPQYLPLIAAISGTTELIDFLAKHHVALDVAQIDQSTAVHIAAFYGNIVAIHALAKHDVPLNTQNISGYTPAEIAVKTGNHEALIALARYQLDLDWSALYSQAKSLGHDHMLPIIVQLAETHQNSPVDLFQNVPHKHGAAMSFEEYQQTFLDIPSKTMANFPSPLLALHLFPAKLQEFGLPPRPLYEIKKTSRKHQIKSCKKLSQYFFFAPFSTKNDMGLQAVNSLMLPLSLALIGVIGGAIGAILFTAKALRAKELGMAGRHLKIASILLAVSIGFAVLTALSPVIVLLANAGRTVATIANINKGSNNSN